MDLFACMVVVHEGSQYMVERVVWGVPTTVYLYRGPVIRLHPLAAVEVVRRLKLPEMRDNQAEPGRDAL